MLIKSAEFVTSAVRPQQYPAAEVPELAFAGRSNVGKSSLINTLVSRRKLVQTSSTPGKTRLINFFRVNDALMLVDLSGLWLRARIRRGAPKMAAHDRAG